MFPAKKPPQATNSKDAVSFLTGRKGPASAPPAAPPMDGDDMGAPAAATPPELTAKLQELIAEYGEDAVEQAAQECCQSEEETPPEQSSLPGDAASARASGL